MQTGAFLGPFAALALGLSPVRVLAQPLPSDHLIVAGSRIGNAGLERADQGSVFRELGEPDHTEQTSDHAYYMYGPLPADGGYPDELVVDFDLTKDEPFEISTASPLYRTFQGLGVGSLQDEVRSKLGTPLCESNGPRGAGLMVYRSIWFLLSRGAVSKVSIRDQLGPKDFKAGPLHC